MSRMNAAWSNEPPWAEAVPAIFKEPMTIAFGGAILAHAIFFLGLPVVAGTEKQPDVQPVATTFLTDQEKSQIPPELSQSQFSPGTLPGTLLPGNNSGLTVPPMPSTVVPPTNADNGLGTFTFGQPYSAPTSNGGYSTGVDNSSANEKLIELAKQQDKAQKEQIKKAAIAKKQADDDNERAKTAPGTLPTVPVNAMPPGTPQGETQKPSEKPTSPQSPAQQPVKKDDQVLIAANPELYALVQENTGPVLGVKLQEAIGNWYNRDPKTKAIYERSEGKEQLKPSPVKTETGTIPYPKQVGKLDVAVIPGYAEKVASAKDRRFAYGTAIVGIATNGKGEFLIKPSIIQSTGHRILDEYAIEYVELKQKFQVTGKDEFYMMIIPIDPPITKPTA